VRRASFVCNGLREVLRFSSRAAPELLLTMASQIAQVAMISECSKRNERKAEGTARPNCARWFPTALRAIGWRKPLADARRMTQNGREEVRGIVRSFQESLLRIETR